MSNVPYSPFFPSQTGAKTVFWFGLILSIFSLSSCGSASILLLIAGGVYGYHWYRYRPIK